MKKIIIITALVGVLLAAGIGTAIFSSYGSITGYTTIEQAIILDIMGSSNDQNYTLSGYQGETLFSPEIKLNNKADTNITVNVTVSLLVGNYSDVNITITDDTKNNTIGNIIAVPTTDRYIRVKHQFYPNSSIGNYSFLIEAGPV